MLAKIIFSVILSVSAYAGSKVTPEQALEAAAVGNVVTLKKFKTSKGDLNTQNSHGLTPLMQAVANGQRKAVDYLLSQKVNLELKNENGDTALAMALGNDHDQIAASLINAGAKTDVLGGENKNTLMFIAASTNATKTLELLTKKAPEQINQKNQKGEAPLHEAARYGSEKTLQILLNAGADKALKNNEGKIPLDIANSIQNEAAAKLLK
ncbi:MAG: ankyrin repeat domain-containing protein [Bdellovibrionales bacterium]|nr:ankyrin repeat domain-containing protein [Bdellovibrionales bacterium]